jgi:hypothetical protein
MHQSFQTSAYNHAEQHQTLGPSGLKIFNGEDLSILKTIKPAAIANDFNSYNQISGGDNNNNKNKIDSNNNKIKKKPSTNKHCKLQNIEGNLKKRNKKD